MSFPVSPGSPPAPRLRALFAPALIALLTFAAYANTFQVPFHFDDLPSIFQNPTLRSFRDAWSPPSQWGVTVSGRPLLNLSLALNYAISGFDPWSYHVFNLAVHIGAALTLYGIVRRTLLLSSIPAVLRDRSTEIAAVAALLWSVHPLQTESVTYVIQRAESLMGLFYLLTFYAVIRSVDSPRAKGWQAAAVVACCLGAATKEVIATAPLLVLLYDRAFLSGSLRSAWQQRRGLYLGLSLSWIVLGALVLSTGGDRGGTFALNREIATTYWASQTQAVLEYARLSIWPHPLVFERGLPYVPESWHFPVFIVLVGGSVIGTLFALWKWPRVGFFGAWFFMILAPTSVLPGTIQAVVEHRMYLSLAAILVGGVCGLTWRFGPRALLALLLLAPVAAFFTSQRNSVYRDDFTLWSDTLAHSSRSAIAEGNVGLALFTRGDVAAAAQHYEKSLRIDPTPPNSHYNLGLTYLLLGRNDDALHEFATTVALNPRHYPAHFEAGKLLRSLGRVKEAEEYFRRALAQKPDLAPVYQQLGLLATDAGDWIKAAAAFNEAWRLEPQLTPALMNLGVAEFRLGKLDDAARHLELALHASPESAEAHFSLGQVRVSQGDRENARREFNEALRIDPKSADAHLNLGLLFAQDGDVTHALPHFEAAANAAPQRADTHGNFANALLESGKEDEALREYATSLKLDPSNPRVHLNFANALLKQQRLPEALQQFAATARLDPTDVNSAEMVERLRAYLAQPH